MNWWGTTNDTEIGALIYDYYDDYNVSRVLFEPSLTSPIPEFPSLVILPLFMITTLLAVTVCRRKSIGQLKTQNQRRFTTKCTENPSGYKLKRARFVFLTANDKFTHNPRIDCGLK